MKIDGIDGRWWEPVHFSNLKHMAECAELYQWHCTHDDPETAWARIGLAFHSRVLGGLEVVCFEGRRDPRSREWQDFQREHSGSEILIASEYRVVAGMVESVMRHPIASSLLARCPIREEKITGTLIGFECEGRIDFRGPGLLGELKSDTVVRPDRWQRRVQYMGYPAQLDWYRTLLNSPNPEECYSIVVGKAPPHLVVVHHATERLLEDGRRAWRLWLEQLRVCADSGVWPGYSESIVEWDSAELEQGEAVEWEEAS